jgi:hypothetical protein
MVRNTRAAALLGISAFALGWAVSDRGDLVTAAEAQAAHRVFELRTYTAAPGRLDDLNARFADHTVQLFERHGMTNIGYFTPQDAPLSESTLIYLLAHDSRAAAEASWTAFRADPEWQRVVEATQRDGRLAEKVESVFLDPTAFSHLK